MPSAMSISATANSMASPTWGGMTTLNTMISSHDDDRDRVAQAPQRADQRRVGEPSAAVEDRRNRDDVVGIGGVAHAQQEPESGQRKQLGHLVSVGEIYCNHLQ